MGVCVTPPGSRSAEDSNETMTAVRWSGLGAAMPLSTQLFRESALERLSSPEQLDRVLVVTSPKGWLSLIAIWTVLGAVVAWFVATTVGAPSSPRS